ncbi:MAG: hypothetical protein C0514_08610 [Candidatus Puniceispirillum sp.]|nr:hypothetical protein [Candidatus Puniceispirillum sp.]
MLKNTKKLPILRILLCAQFLAHPSNASLLEELETFLRTSPGDRALTFVEAKDQDSITFQGASLKIVSEDPDPYLRALQKIETNISLSALKLRNCAVLDPALLPKTLLTLHMEGCALKIDDTLLKGIGETLPELVTLAISGKRYYPIHNQRHASPRQSPPLRATFTSLAPLKHLRNLRLETMKFPNLPEDINTLANLQSLSLTRNHDLLALPNTLRELKKLQTLEITHTHVTEVPKWIGELTSLSELSLGYMDDQLADVRTQWVTSDLPQGQSLTLPLGTLLHMENLVIRLGKQDAAPYVETFVRNGLTRTANPDKFVVEPRAHQGRLRYLWTSYGILGDGPRKAKTLQVGSTKNR